MNEFDIALNELTNLNEEDIPTIIKQKTEEIVSLSALISEAKQKCNEAREVASRQISTKILIFGSGALNSTQDAVKAIAESQEMLANVQALLFIHQQEMSNAMRYLLLVGASSIAASKRVKEELEALLKKAESEKLSPEAKEEIIHTIQMLKEQESAFSKQDEMMRELSQTKGNVNNQAKLIDEISLVDARQDAIIDDNTRVNEIQEIELGRQREKDEEHSRAIKKLHLLSYLAIGSAVIACILSIVGLLF